MATSLELQVKDLAGLFYWPADKGNPNQINFHGSTIRRQFIRTRQSPICPECLQSDPYTRAIWDLALITHCPHHGLELLEVCPRCATSNTRNRSDLGLCQGCGLDFRTAKSRKVPRNELNIENVILNSLGIDCAGAKASVMAFPNLLTLGPDELMKTVLFLGSIQCGTKAGIGYHQCARNSVSEMAALIDKASVVLADWPNNFHNFLEEQRITVSGGVVENWTSL